MINLEQNILYKLEHLLDLSIYYLSLGLINWIQILQEYWWAIGLIAGWIFVSSFLIKDKIIQITFFFIFLFSLVAQPFLYFFLPDISQELWNKYYTLPIKHLYGYIGGFVVSGIAAFFTYRYTSSWVDRLKDRFTKKTVLQKDSQTDIRDMSSSIPEERKPYKVEKYFKKNMMFIGLDVNSKPVYLTADRWLSNHVDLVGSTGLGKGIAAGVMLTQASLVMGEAVIVIDPKNDEYMPHVLAQNAKNLGLPFYSIDLMGEFGQWNPLSYKTSIQIEELLSAGLSLSDVGDASDFHRLNDRKAARIFSNMDRSQNVGFSKQVSQFFNEHTDVLEDAKKFREGLEELVSLPVVNVKNGLDLDKAIQKGAIIYVRGSMRHEPVKKLQKMFVLAVIQSCESRERETARHVCLFLDEFKYLISKPALEALGAIRDKRAHIILAHQSFGDLRAADDIDPIVVESSISENCALKLAYKVMNPKTAKLLAEMSGEIIVEDVNRRFETKTALTELKVSEKSLRQSRRNLIDVNMLISLPPRCGVLFGDDEAKFVFTSPIKVNKDPRWTTPTVFDDPNDDDINNKPSGSISEDLLDVD